MVCLRTSKSECEDNIGKLCLKKRDICAINLGGLGIRRVRMSEIMLTKLGWRVISRPDSLLARVLAAKYANKKSWWGT